MARLVSVSEGHHGMLGRAGGQRVPGHVLTTRCEAGSGMSIVRSYAATVRCDFRLPGRPGPFGQVVRPLHCVLVRIVLPRTA
jgi:hypothetical protein